MLAPLKTMTGYKQWTKETAPSAFNLMEVELLRLHLDEDCRVRDIY
jgi:hypothetical protein